MFVIEKTKQCDIVYNHKPHTWLWRLYPYEPVLRQCEGVED